MISVVQVLAVCAVVGYAAAQSLFTCRNGNRVSANYKCDGDNDCGDGSDEYPYTSCYSCNGNSWKCPTTSKCIRRDFLCDGDNDCGDYARSDESSPVCPVRRDGSGSSSIPGFLCNNGNIIPRAFLCDGDNDCRDYSDESRSVCPSGCTLTWSGRGTLYTIGGTNIGSGRLSASVGQSIYVLGCSAGTWLGNDFATCTASGWSRSFGTCLVN